MSDAPARGYDVAIVGAGPVGSLCALAHAREGARVILLEANPKASRRLAGEWLHPAAVRILQDVGVDPDSLPGRTQGRGFVVFPEDGTDPILLPYQGESLGLACEHQVLVARLHEAIASEDAIDFVTRARVTAVGNSTLTYACNGVAHSLRAGRIVGADGRASVVRRSLGLPTEQQLCSRMLGILLEGVDLEFEDYGHVFLGGPGPVLMYRPAPGRVRIIVDVPVNLWSPQDRLAFLSESYAALLPEPLRHGFVEALCEGRYDTAANRIMLRVTYGTDRCVLIGDAAGHYHPITAVGMTLGFGDALDLARGGSFRDFTARRFQAIRVPELLAAGLYEVFVDDRAEAAILRHAIYQGWRSDNLYRERTVRILACEDRSVFAFSMAFSRTMFQAIGGFLSRRRNLPGRFDARVVIKALLVRLSWLIRGAWHLANARRSGGREDTRIRDHFSRAFLCSMTSGTRQGNGLRSRDLPVTDTAPALHRATARLLALQGDDGGWEGEMVWCPMLTAQYVLLHHIIGKHLEPDRRRRVLRSFGQTRLPGGSWGMHEHSRPHLFVTVLVYVAARLIGVERGDPLIEPARNFIQREDTLNIPSWGKFWLALLNLYDWHGINAILPELWALPRWLPIHPSKWYCHTRLIYMAMAVIYRHRHQVPVTPEIARLREELYPRAYADTDFSRARNSLRDADLFGRPGTWLRLGYACSRLYERCHSGRLRQRCAREIIGQIRWELAVSHHTSISPVSGLLNILALWLDDRDDADAHKALQQLEGWIWEDEEAGTRITGARSASWDTGFALQALATAQECPKVRQALDRGAAFLSRHQIRTSFKGYESAWRADPRGGWCFAGAWHGWPVSDCTAEAVLGLIAAQGRHSDPDALRDAIRFMLDSQNPDGGFGSYEARRPAMSLEWLNPAEMFGESMTEQSFVECTASCLAAFAAAVRTIPGLADRSVTHAISRGCEWLHRTQNHDGSWRGVWGVQYIYGTLFGIRGLLAAGVRSGDPALCSARRWLLARQREDGGWGEHHSGCLEGRYVEHTESQVIQTAWALIALLEAGETDWPAISRGVQFLIDSQDAEGAWPKQDMAGVFFRTALLDYTLYRQYFPLHVLGLYEARRRHRSGLAVPSAPGCAERQGHGSREALSG